MPGSRHVDFDDEDVELERLIEDNHLDSNKSTPAGDFCGHESLGMIVLVGAFVSLVPGLCYPAVNLEAVLFPAEVVKDMRENIDGMLKSELGSFGSLFGNMADGLIDKLANSETLRQPLVVMSIERSVFGSIRELWSAGHIFIACLISLFSICVPFTKLILVTIASFGLASSRIGQFGRSLSKWSMADVFAVGIFISMLAINSISGGQRLRFTAALEPGFYWFALHTLLSCFSSMLLEPQHSATFDNKRTS